MGADDPGFQEKLGSWEFFEPGTMKIPGQPGILLEKSRFSYRARNLTIAIPREPGLT